MEASLSMSLEGRRILVADDERLFLESLVEHFNDRGAKAAGCSSGVEVFEFLKTPGWEILVSDIDMPGNSGLELVRTLTESGHLLPVVLLTGVPSFQTARDAVGTSVRAYLEKPVDFELLDRTVLNVLGEADAKREASAVEARICQSVERWNLTPQQGKVLAELVMGRANKDIASVLGCQVRTIEVHIGRLFRAAQVESRGELIANFWRN